MFPHPDFPSGGRRGTGHRLRRILEERAGTWISGREIGERLGTSRAAVWKQVRALRREGFLIEGVRGAGYRLVESPDRLREEEIRSLLPRGNPFAGRIELHEAIDSTNARAAAMAESGAPEGTAVVADTQTAGRGRMGRRWESPAGINLYVSLLLRPPIPPQEAPKLTVVTGVALAEAVEEVAGVAARLKWPNDLYLGERKAAGILAEMSADPDRLRHVVIGVGLNVNSLPAHFPEPIREKATSLRIAGGRTFRRAEVLARFLDRFARGYSAFLAEGFPEALAGWRRRSLLDGRRVLLRHRETELWGTARGVDGEGRLVFLPDGAARPERIVSGEVVAFGG